MEDILLGAGSRKLHHFASFSMQASASDAHERTYEGLTLRASFVGLEPTSTTLKPPARGGHNVVLGVGFEPTKAKADRFTVCCV